MRGGEATGIAAGTVAENRALVDKGAPDSQWPRNEVGKVMQRVGSGVNTVGQQINPGK